MKKVDNNRLGALAEVISIDAWHEEFGTNKHRADLHADVVFSTGRLGGEKESQVRFRLAIKRAELVVILSETEPVEIDRRSIARHTEVATITQATTKTTKRVSSAGGGAKLEAAARGLSASAKLDAKTGIERKTEDKWTQSQEVPAIKVTHRLHIGDGTDRWGFEARGSETLEGRPWDPVKAPLLTLIDRRKDRSRGLPPSVRLEIRCLREDLQIHDIVLKDERLHQRIMRRVGKENRLKAAEAYIRNQLEEAGLEFGDLRDAFSKLTLAHAFAKTV